MQIVFGILSVAYVVCIFLFAGSAAVSQLSHFNPYSLLHIPLYGVLVILLILSMVPFRRLRIPGSHPRWKKYFIISGSIAFAVALADEYHQSFLPNRTASLGDVFLDLVGIVLFLYLFRRYQLRLQRPPLSPSQP
jgi:VanZ family protein